MLTIRADTVKQPDKKYVAELKKKFSEKGYVHFHKLLEEGLCNKIISLLSEAPYVERLTENIGCVEVCQRQSAVDKLNSMLSDARVLKVVNKVYGGPPVEFYMGNIVRRIPGKNHFSNYHNDNSDLPYQIKDGTYRRSIAMSLNLSPAPFVGGELGIGDYPSGFPRNDQFISQLGREIFLDNEEKVPNPMPGDGLMFGISPTKFHRVEDVTEGGPRVVFVGWFFARR